MSTATTTSPTTRRTWVRRLVPATVVVVLVVAGLVAWRLLGQDPTVPYEDPQSAGLITLCSADGEAVTEGSVDDRPFADLAVGETGLPAEFDPAGTVASLFAYQPRETIAADEFSGAPLTAAGLVADPGQPAVLVTEDAWSIGDFVTAFPADYDGFVQLRLYLGTPAAGTLTDRPYDTADLRVDGDSWELIRGGTASCAEAGALVK